LVTERNAAQKALTQSFEQHPDAHIYASLPGAGEFLVLQRDFDPIIVYHAATSK
jgi:hypothetical protein